MIAALDLGLIFGLMALGVYLTFRILDFADLTIDGSFTTGAATAAILLVGGAVYGGRAVVNRMFLHNPEYNLAAVEIADDGAALSRELVLSTANLAVGQNIFTVSLATALRSYSTRRVSPSGCRSSRMARRVSSCRGPLVVRKTRSPSIVVTRSS